MMDDKLIEMDKVREKFEELNPVPQYYRFHGGYYIQCYPISYEQWFESVKYHNDFHVWKESFEACYPLFTAESDKNLAACQAENVRLREALDTVMRVSIDPAISTCAKNALANTTDTTALDAMPLQTEMEALRDELSKWHSLGRAMAEAGMKSLTIPLKSEANPSRDCGLQRRAWPASVAEMQKEINALREDAERLDWLQNNRQSIYIVVQEKRRPLTDGTNGSERYSEFLGWSTGVRTDELPTVRAAIDEARGVK